MNTWFTGLLYHLLFINSYLPYFLLAYMWFPISNQTSVFFCCLNMVKSISQSWLGLTLSAFSTPFAAISKLPGHFICGEIMVKIPKFHGSIAQFCRGLAYILAGPQAPRPSRRHARRSLPRLAERGCSSVFVFFLMVFESRNPETRRDFTRENGDWI